VLQIFFLINALGKEILFLIDVLTQWLVYQSLIYSTVLGLSKDYKNCIGETILLYWFSYGWNWSSVALICAYENIIFFTSAYEKLT
jgi:hypothetical protein